MAANGHVADLDSDKATSTELLADHLPGAHVVKAFNTMHYPSLAVGGDRSKPLHDRPALFVAGDDVEAKKVVGGLIEELGFAAIDTGALASGGRRQQPGSPIHGANMTAAEAPHALG